MIHHKSEKGPPSSNILLMSDGAKLLCDHRSRKFVLNGKFWIEQNGHFARFLCHSSTFNNLVRTAKHK